MSDKKISQLPAATTPLDGTETLPIVQSGDTKKVTNNDLRPKQIQSNATSGVLQIAGPAAGTTRVMTVPDANFTAAKTNTGQTFTGDQIFNGTITARRSSGDFTGYSIGYGGVNNPILGFNMTDGSSRYRFNMNSDVDIKLETNSGGVWYTALQINRVGRDVTLGTGNLVIGTSGKGIDFSADGSAAGMTSELLDDYEEGTFTPTITDAASGGNIGSASTVAGHYVKVGRLVTIAVDLVNIDTTGLTSGNYLYIGNLPFTAFSGSGSPAWTGSVLGASTWTLITTGIVSNILENTNYIRFVKDTDASAGAYLTVGAINSGASDARFSMTYFAA